GLLHSRTVETITTTARATLHGGLGGSEMAGHPISIAPNEQNITMRFQSHRSWHISAGQHTNLFGQFDNQFITARYRASNQDARFARNSSPGRKSCPSCPE